MLRPAFGVAIKKLEDDLQVKLLEHSTNEITLTSRCEKIKGRDAMTCRLTRVG